MKHLTTISSLLFFISLFSIRTASAQLVEVRIGVPPPRPRVVVVERPICPGRDYDWVEGHYVYDSYSRRDVWIPGQWVYVAPHALQQGMNAKSIIMDMDATMHQIREKREMGVIMISTSMIIVFIQMK